MQRKDVATYHETQSYTEKEFIFMLGEELKRPLMTIKALAETDNVSQSIQMQAKKALRSVDSLLLYQTVSTDGQSSLTLGPVHVGSALSAVAHELRPLSIDHGCETEVFIQSGIAPVEASLAALQSGLSSMWQAVLGMTERPSALSWHVRKSAKGITVALYSGSIDLTKVHLSGSTKTAGKSRQPFSGLSGPATDLVSAQGIFSMLGGTLKKSKKDGAQGLQVTLPVSPQLSLV